MHTASPKKLHTTSLIAYTVD